MGIRGQKLVTLLPYTGTQRAALFCTGGESLQVVVMLVKVRNAFIGGKAANRGFDWLGFANPRGC